MYVRTSDWLGRATPYAALSAEESSWPIELLKRVYEWGKPGFITPQPLQKELPKLLEPVRSATERPRARHAQPREKVCWIQAVLNKELGANLTTDGLYGPLTRQAIRRFQERSGLAVDGVVGPRTETALTQSALNQLAQASRLPVNGVMDEPTRNAIRRFQASRSLTPDGIVGPRTRFAMVTALGGRCIIPASGTVRKPRQPPTCDQAELQRRLSACEKEHWRCLGEIGLIPIIEKMKSLQHLPACLIAIRSGNVLGILKCAINVGIVDIDMADKMMKQYKKCAFALDICRHNAKGATRCL